MRKIEFVLIIMIIIGLALTLLLIPGGSIIFGLSSGLLAMLYYPLGFMVYSDIPIKGVFKKSSYSHTNTRRIFGSVVVGIVLSIIIIGCLFRINIYPGDQIMLRMGLSLLTIGLVVTLILYFQRNKDVFYKQILIRILIIGAIGITLVFIPTDFLIDVRFRDRPEAAKLLKKMKKDPQNKELKEEWRKLNSKETN